MNKEYCGDRLYDDIFALMHKIKVEFRECGVLALNPTENTNKLITKIQPPIERIREERDLALSELRTAIRYLAEGKKIFMPHTTNSFVDEFLEKHKEILTPQTGAK